ncbi:hypothetical protein [Sulfurimonas sp.]|jgi:hypothetical protein|uniref:hypothetical protein n=1 Tax=Sulfurimonas sp. TaxID=2022749 RepID=UPI0025F16E75|nr:hypothetical protein [Sulfurimonas sp.]MCK9474257.1 hypothetical protein [Sulfurimonas sp.]
MSKDNLRNILGDNTANNLYDSSNVAANANGSIIERQEYIQSQVSAISSGQVILQGVAPAATNSTTVVVISALAGYGNDFFNNQFYMQILHNDNSAGDAPEKEVRQITDYVSATGTFTMTAFSAAVEAGDLCLIIHESQVAIGKDDNNNTFASTAVVANADGSILERLEYIQGQVSGTDSAANILGANDADNGFASADVVANEDGSILERLEQIQEATNKGTGTAMAANKSIADALGTDGNTVTDSSSSVLGAVGANNNNNAFSSSLVAPNIDGSVLERLEAIMRAGGLTSLNPNYGVVTIEFAALTTGSVATHEILTITGEVRLWLMPVCTTNVAGNGTIELGIDSDTNLYVNTTNAADIDANEVWIKAAPDDVGGNYSTLVLDKVVVGGSDVGYEIKTDTLESGVIEFHYAWLPISADGNVVAADGTDPLV